MNLKLNNVVMTGDIEEVDFSKLNYFDHIVSINTSKNDDYELCKINKLKLNHYFVSKKIKNCFYVFNSLDLHHDIYHDRDYSIEEEVIFDNTDENNFLLSNNISNYYEDRKYNLSYICINNKKLKLNNFVSMNSNLCFKKLSELCENELNFYKTEYFAINGKPKNQEGNYRLLFFKINEDENINNNVYLVINLMYKVNSKKRIFKEIELYLVVNGEYSILSNNVDIYNLKKIINFMKESLCLYDFVCDQINSELKLFEYDTYNYLKDNSLYYTMCYTLDYLNRDIIYDNYSLQHIFENGIQLYLPNSISNNTYYLHDPNKLVNEEIREVANAIIKFKYCEYFFTRINPLTGEILDNKYEIIMDNTDYIMFNDYTIYKKAYNSYYKIDSYSKEAKQIQKDYRQSQNLLKDLS